MATTTVHGTRRYAKARLAGYARLRAGTVADLLDRWVEAASPRWAKTTDDENRHDVSHYLKALLGHLPVAKVTTADVDDLSRYLLSCGRDDGGALAASTVRRVHGVLHRAFAQAVRWEWVWFNPVSNASPPRAEPAEICPPPVHDVRGLWTMSARSTQLSSPSYGWPPARERGAASYSGCGGPRSTSSIKRSGSPGHTWMLGAARCCRRPRPTNATGWRSTTRRW
jgi:hypothetical protein